MDPLRHPDLLEVGRRLRDVFDRAAAAELETIRVAHARTRGLRDLLIEWEDAQRPIRVTVGTERLEPMPIHGVGMDHVLLRGRGSAIALPFEAIAAIEAAE